MIWKSKYIIISVCFLVILATIIVMTIVFQGKTVSDKQETEKELTEKELTEKELTEEELAQKEAAEKEAALEKARGATRPTRAITTMDQQLRQRVSDALTEDATRTWGRLKPAERKARMISTISQNNGTPDDVAFFTEKFKRWLK